MFFKIQNPKVPRKPLQKCSQFIASSSQNSQKARGKNSKYICCKKTPQDKNLKWQKCFGWTLHTMETFKGVRFILKRSLKCSKAYLLPLQTVCGQRIEMHRSEKGILTACFPRGQLILNCCFLIGPLILLFFFFIRNTFNWNFLQNLLIILQPLCFKCIQV